MNLNSRLRSTRVSWLGSSSNNSREETARSFKAWKSREKREREKRRREKQERKRADKRGASRRKKRLPHQGVSEIRQVSENRHLKSEIRHLKSVDNSGG